MFDSLEVNITLQRTPLLDLTIHLLRREKGHPMRLQKMNVNISRLSEERNTGRNMDWGSSNKSYVYW